MIRQFELVERVQSYDPDADEEMLNRAYVYGLKKHGTQLRASGDPYFSHPVEVAGILAEMKLDTSSIVTGLLHDTLEDTDATRDEIARLFGENVARLVDGVTKLSRLEVQSESTKEAENLRKLVLAMSSDIRVLLVKLADRLHNMRTLHHIKDPARRRRIARETMDLYAPLASRIGMEKVKRELEELAFAELNPDGRASVQARQGYLRERGERLVPEIEAELIKTLKDGGLGGAGLGAREDALFDLAQDADQERLVRAARRHHGLPHHRRRRRRSATRRSACCTAATRCCRSASRTTSRCPSRTATARCTPA